MQALTEVVQENDAVEESVLEQLWNEFDQATYQGKIDVYRTAVQSRSLDRELAFEFLIDLKDQTEKQGEPEKHDELLALLRQYQPDVYEAEEAYLVFDDNEDW